MGYLGSHIEDYWPHQLLADVIRQIKTEKQDFPKDEIDKIKKMIIEIELLINNKAG